MNFDVTLKGFDGGTDETDDLVKWVSAPNIELVNRYIDATGLREHVRDVTPFREGDQLTFADGIDIILEDHSCDHEDEVRIADDLWMYSIEDGNRAEDWIKQRQLILEQ